MKFKIVILSIICSIFVGCSANPKETASTTTPSEDIGQLDISNILNKSYEIKPRITKPEITVSDVISSAEAQKLAKDYAVSANKFYNDYNSQYELLTYDGFLFNSPAKEFVNKDYLVDLGGLVIDEKFNNVNVSLLYLKEGEFVGKTDENSPYTVYSVVGNKEGLFLSDKDGNVEKIERDKLNEVLEKYKMNESITYRHNQNNPIYKEVLAACATQSGLPQDGLQFRFFTANDKYAYVLASEKSNPSKFHTYALEKKSNWEVLMSDFQNEYQAKKIINSKYPDFSYTLFPTFDPYYVIKDVTGNYSELQKSFEKALNIAESEKLDFISGVSDYVYFSYKSGKCFLASANESGEWTVNPVGNYFVAETLLEEKGQDASLIILYQK